MRTFLALAFIVLSATQIYAHVVHNCVHDSIEHNFVHHEVPTDEEYTKRSLADPVYSPFRIVANYDYLNGLTAAQTTFLKTKLIPDVITFFNKALSVVRYNTAGTITVPSGKCFDATVPASYVSPGLSADIVLFIYATLPSGGALAVGGACFLGNDKRPIAGMVNFNAATVNADPLQYASQLSIIQHEVTHALGFTNGLYQYWKTAPKNTQTVNWRGTAGTIINTTRVAETARRHFACSNLTGVEIENQGGSGSMGSHWERRVLGNEAMTASVSNDGRYSYFTLALLEDSGWYRANYSMAAPLDFGKNRGCSYIFQTCINPVTKTPRFPEFCVASGSACTVDGSAKGYCSIAQASSTTYNYLGNNSTSSDPFNDECPTYSGYSNGGCSDTTLTPAYYLPEKYSATSKCFAGSLLDARYVNDGSTRYGCYSATCSTVNGVKKISIIIGNTTIPCSGTGAQLTNIPGYSGNLICPDAAQYCADRSTQIINPNLAA